MTSCRGCLTWLLPMLFSYLAKATVSRRLEWIITASQGKLNPSKKILKRVNDYLFSRWFERKAGDVPALGTKSEQSLPCHKRCFWANVSLFQWGRKCKGLWEGTRVFIVFISIGCHIYCSGAAFRRLSISALERLVISTTTKYNCMKQNSNRNAERTSKVMYCNLYLLHYLLILAFVCFPSDSKG